MQTTSGPIRSTSPSLAPIPSPTPSQVARLFPATPIANIAANLPAVLAALAAANIADKAMILMALATIRAETGSFQPLTEGVSRFNTSPNGRPFDLYDHRRDLGNQGPPDGADFRGRGFIQLTGRANYTHYSAGIGHDLVADPTLANQPAIAAQLLACFLGDKESAIRHALAAGNLAAARRLVNGGTHGLDNFASAFNIGTQLIA